MIKKDIVNVICQSTFLSSDIVNDIVDVMLDCIGDALARGEKVQFAGFGSFEPQKRNARVGRNPHTKEAVPIPARIVPNFKPGKALNAKVCHNIKAPFTSTI